MLTLFLIFIKKFFLGKNVPIVKGYTSNTALKTIKQDWLGTPLDQHGLFMNHEFPTVIRLGAIIKFMLGKNPQKQFKKKDTWRIPVEKNDDWLMDSSDKIVWLGHASFFIQLSGIRILIDPIFGSLPVGKRYSPLPVDPEKLLHINYILVSHAHYDHCDKKSIKLLAKNNPEAQILVGLKLETLIAKWINNPIQSAGWYQQYQLDNELTITFLPSRHWANRSPFDANTSLWGGFMIQSKDKCLYYGGDSGYGSHFKAIGELFPAIDVALIGAGAYAPTWFMSPNHQDPYNAAKAFNETGAKTFIPFHYGTFDAADEPMSEPEKILTTLKAAGKINNELQILHLGKPFGV
ncbi:MBL fold metallo-hydrolase [Cellulophaga sp. BC115SP]|uniref:MBL fold metallo-hydrolase n=1 Tax=Cellulophaga sp. BC115SP TaxID=2683263 RepID=UPI001412386A|nr:MBL fold metallo-hydrolase [Cellulophaga sp. BC115SP]NBB30331.1 Zn-dependent hydrolase [Cellulophaga sp. BC115SP]